MKRLMFLMMIVALAATGVALAAKPVKGATYAGTIQRDVGNITFPISFKVSKNGKTVSSFKLADSFPVYCQGGGFPHIGDGGSGSITKKGTFTAKLPLLAISTNKRDGLVVISGKFIRGGTASGKVRTDISGSFGKSCNGSSSFTARG
jgi:hypothetical protein